MDGADPVPALTGYCVSGGRLNAYKALNEAEIMNTFALDNGWTGNFNSAKATGRTVSGDFRGIGRDDIAVIYDAGNVRVEIHVWLSDENGNFTYDGLWWDGTGIMSGGDLVNGAIAGDFDGDSKTDIAMLCRGSGAHTMVFVWLSLGFRFTLQEWWDAPNTIYAPSVANRIVAGDFNSDGKADIGAICDEGGTTSSAVVWLSEKLPTATLSGREFKFTFATWWHSTTVLYAPSIAGRVVAGDFNSDGKDDIAALCYDGATDSSMLVWQSTGIGFTFSTRWDSAALNANDVAGIAVGDINCDGKMDIAAISKGTGTHSRILVWLSTGSGFIFQTWWDTSSVLYAPDITGRVVAGKFRDDGTINIAALWYDGIKVTHMLLWKVR